MQKQKKTTLTESQVKLKKYLKPIVEGILTEQSDTLDSEMAKMLIDKLGQIVPEVLKIYKKYQRITGEYPVFISDKMVDRAISSIILMKRDIEKKYK